MAPDDGEYGDCRSPKSLHSTIGYLSPMEFEKQAGFASVHVNETGAGQSLMSSMSFNASLC
jgi:hypothetical protein